MLTASSPHIDESFTPALAGKQPTTGMTEPVSVPGQALLNALLSRVDVNPYVTAATEYTALSERLRERLQNEGAAAMAKRLGLTLSAYYNKRRGVKPLVAADIELLTHYFHEPADRLILKRYYAVRNALCASVSTLPLDRNVLISRAGLTYHEFYRRSKAPTLWRPEELLQMGHALTGLKAELWANLPGEVGTTERSGLAAGQ